MAKPRSDWRKGNSNGEYDIKTKLVLMFWLMAIGLAGVESARAFYNPEKGRWLKRDPLEDIAFRDHSIWRTKQRQSRTKIIQATLFGSYVFTQNNAVMFFDKSGLFQWGQECSAGRYERLYNDCNVMVEDACNVHKLDDALWETFGYLSFPTASCLLKGCSDTRIECESGCNPVCWGKTGYNYALGARIHLCPSLTTWAAGSGECNNWARTVLHEQAELCGMTHEQALQFEDALFPGTWWK